MKVHVHLLTNDADWVLVWALRHYCEFAHVFVHDGGPSWKEHDKTLTQELCSIHGATWVQWDTAGQLNDDLACKLKNECWKGTDADWVICGDADELAYFPRGAHSTLEKLDANKAAMIKLRGYEMFSETMPDGRCSMDRGHQIWDEIKMGSFEFDWYSKPSLFSPKRVVETGFGIGAHEARPVLKDGRALYISRRFPAHPEVLLLHYHQIGTAEQVAARYDATRKRLAAINERNRWGNFESGADHVQTKRKKILPYLEQVIP